MFINFSVKNPTFVNLLMVVIILVGIVSYRNMPRELIPQFNSNAISISTFYAGTSPEEMDKLVTAEIEDAIDDLEGIDEITSTSQEGMSRVTITTDTNYTDDETYVLLDEVRSAIDSIKSDLPEDANDPTVALVKPNIPIINVAIYGDVPEYILKDEAEKLQDIIEGLDGVNKVTITGVRDREIWIEVSPVALEKYGLGLDSVYSVISRAQLDLAAGVIKSRIGEYLIRTSGETDRAQELAHLVVYADPSGNQVLLSDVAKISDTFADAVTIGRFNGKPSVILILSKDATGDAIDIADAVYAAVGEFQNTLPDSISVGTFSDTSVFVRERLSTLLKQGGQALVLVLATLMLFLSLRMAFFTALGIPLSFLGGVIILGFLGYTMNMITMFAFIMVLGLVVDDAIVISENCFRLIEKGIKPRVAAVIGTQQMLWPVLAAVSTTIAAFLPLLMLPGRMGKFMGAIPVTICVVLAFSLLECLLILPSHIADWTPEKTNEKLARKREKNGRNFFDWFLSIYEVVLRFVINWRYVFIISMFLLLFVSIAYAVYRIPLKFSGEFDSDQFLVNIECPATYRIEDTLLVAHEVEQSILALPKNELMGFSTTVGIYADNPYSQRFASNISQFYVDLSSIDERRETSVIMDEVRQRIKKIPQVTAHNIFALTSNPGGKAIEAFISGPDISTLRELSTYAKEFVERQPGARDASSDFVLGKRELVVTLNDRAKSLGFDNMSVASQLRSAYSGAEAARIRPGSEDYPIYVRYDSTLRTERTSLDQLLLVAPSGVRVRLVDVAAIADVPGLQSLKRRDGKRTITVSAEVNEKEGNASMIVTALVADLGKVIKERYPGFSITPGGQQKELNESMGAMLQAGLLAMVLILVILVALFRSLFKPLIIMVPIPLSMIGVVLGHVVHGSDLVIMSFMGTVALAGVVVNDSILLLDFINHSRKSGMSPLDAAVNSGKMRMRPVILTTVTTICGLASLAFFATGQTQFLSPMAISIIWGLGFATLITLLAIPALYMIYSDVRKLLGRSEESEFSIDRLQEEVEEVQKSGMLIK